MKCVRVHSLLWPGIYVSGLITQPASWEELGKTVKAVILGEICVIAMMRRRRRSSNLSRWAWQEISILEFVLLALVALLVSQVNGRQTSRANVETSKNTQGMNVLK